MPFTDESVPFREKEGEGYGGDPTWTAEAIVWLDQDISAKRGEGTMSERLEIRMHSRRKY